MIDGRFLKKNMSPSTAGADGHTATADVASPPDQRARARNVPELAAELDHVINTFDPWARDRGEYYSLDWKPRAGATTDFVPSTIEPASPAGLMIMFPFSLQL